MGTQVRNKPIEQAQAELAQQLAPRDERPSGDASYDAATAERLRLAKLYESGHDAKSNS